MLLPVALHKQLLDHLIICSRAQRTHLIQGRNHALEILLTQVLKLLPGYLQLRRPAIGQQDIACVALALRQRLLRTHNAHGG